MSECSTDWAMLAGLGWANIFYQFTSQNRMPHPARCSEFSSVIFKMSPIYHFRLILKQWREIWVLIYIRLRMFRLFTRVLDVKITHELPTKNSHLLQYLFLSNPLTIFAALFRTSFNVRSLHTQIELIFHWCFWTAQSKSTSGYI